MIEVNFKLLAKRYWLLFLLFLLSTFFFLYQNSINSSWDFISYLKNFEFLFLSGSYFELLRPPLMPVLLGVLSYFSLTYVVQLYIITVSIIFFISSIYFARAVKFNETIYYSLLLTPFLLHYGLINGTELLALSFLQLFAAALLNQKSIAGFYLILSALARYSSLTYFFLLLLLLDLKKIIVSLIYFFSVLGLWFFYNYWLAGNFFASIIDQYANVIYFRQDIVQPIVWGDFLVLGGIFFLFLLIGLFSEIKKLFSNVKKSIFKKITIIKLKAIIHKNKEFILLFAILFMVIYSYVTTPFKESRYLFLGVLPVAYFTYIGLYKSFTFFKQASFFEKKHKTLVLAFGIVIFNFSLLYFLISSNIYSYSGNQYFESIVNELSDRNLTQCQLTSNIWVHLN